MKIHVIHKKNSFQRLFNDREECSEVTSFEEAFTFGSRATKIFCYHCNLTELSDNFERVPNLEKFHSTGGHLQRFPPSFFTLKNLRSINVNHNNIREIPHEVKNLTSLETLDIIDNRLVEISESICQLPKLRRFYMGWHGVPHIPTCLQKLSEFWGTVNKA